jgi:cyclopropane fatty-acyl-phospholipid synthase-like methyltransferase
MHFLERMINEGVDEQMTLILGDVRHVPLGAAASFDVVVAYGLLHCLQSRDEADTITRLIQNLTRPGGINIVSAFTDRLPVPDVQDYLSPTLLPEDHILGFYRAGWTIIEYENDTLSESHPTTCSEHKHSLFRLMARRDE